MPLNESFIVSLNNILRCQNVSENEIHKWVEMKSNNELITVYDNDKIIKSFKDKITKKTPAMKMKCFSIYNKEYYFR